MDFCKAFNAQTQSVEQGLPIPVVITVYADRSFTFVTKTPPAAVLLRKAAGIAKGSATPNTVKVAKVNREQLEEIAKMKIKYPRKRNRFSPSSTQLRSPRKDNGNNSSFGPV